MQYFRYIFKQFFFVALVGFITFGAAAFLPNIDASEDFYPTAQAQYDTLQRGVSFEFSVNGANVDAEVTNPSNTNYVWRFKAVDDVVSSSRSGTSISFGFSDFEGEKELSVTASDGTASIVQFELRSVGGFSGSVTERGVLEDSGDDGPDGDRGGGGSPATERTTEEESGRYNLLAPLPGVGDGTSIDVEGDESFPDYIKSIIALVIGFAILAAILVIIGAGFQYMTTTSKDGTSQAKERIGSAMGGLVLALAAFVILNTINPNLVELNSVETVTTSGEELIDPDFDDSAGTFTQGSEEFGNNFCFSIDGTANLIDIFVETDEDRYVCYNTMNSCQENRRLAIDKMGEGGGGVDGECNYWYEATAVVEQTKNKFPDDKKGEHRGEQVKVTRIDQDRDAALRECRSNVAYASDESEDTLEGAGSKSSNKLDRVCRIEDDNSPNETAVCDLVEGSECSITQERPQTQAEEQISQTWKPQNCYAETGWYFLDTGSAQPFAQGPYKNQESCAEQQRNNGDSLRCYEITQSYLDTPPAGSCGQIYNDADLKRVIFYTNETNPDGYGDYSNGLDSPVEGAWCAEVNTNLNDGQGDGWACWDDKQTCDEYEAVTRRTQDGGESDTDGYLGNDYIVNSCQNSENVSGSDYDHTCADCEANRSASATCNQKNRQDCKNCSTLSSLNLTDNFRGGDRAGDACDITGTNDGQCLVNTELGGKLQNFTSSFSQPWVLTEAWPPTVLHASSCHAQGTCVDIALRQNDNLTGNYPNSTMNINQHAKQVQAFANAAQSAGLFVVYEVGDTALASALRDETSGFEVLQIDGLAPHFSVYNTRSDQGSNDICPL